MSGAQPRPAGCCRQRERAQSPGERPGPAAQGERGEFDNINNQRASVQWAWHQSPADRLQQVFNHIGNGPTQAAAHRQLLTWSLYWNAGHTTVILLYITIRVCMSFSFLDYVHLISLTFGGCLARNTRKCSVECEARVSCQKQYGRETNLPVPNRHHANCVLMSPRLLLLGRTSRLAWWRR